MNSIFSSLKNTHVRVESILHLRFPSKTAKSAINYVRILLVATFKTPRSFPISLSISAKKAQTLPLCSLFHHSFLLYYFTDSIRWYDNWYIMKYFCSWLISRKVIRQRLSIDIINEDTGRKSRYSATLMLLYIRRPAQASHSFICLGNGPHCEYTYSVIAYSRTGNQIHPISQKLQPVSFSFIDL